MSELTEALRSGTQADEDGIMCVVSRQACHEAADKIEKMSALLQAVKSSEFDGLSCNSIDGKNWFDLRDEVFKSA